MHGAEDKESLYGIAAEYEDTDVLIEAARRTKEEGYSDFDAYTPIPVHGLYEAMGGKRTLLGWIVLAAGIAGCIAGFGLQYWVSAVAYPLNVGGRPYLSWPSFIPVTFECTVLLAGLTALFAMCALNKLPQPHHPIFNAEGFDRASRDSFFICIEATDGRFEKEKVKKFLESTGAKNVVEVDS